jgi:hypothetical protein
MGREVGYPGGTVNKDKLKKFKPTAKTPNFEQRMKRFMYMADGGVADAENSPAQNTAISAAQNAGINPATSPNTMDSAAAPNSVYPTPVGESTAKPNQNLALTPMNLTQPARIAKGGKVKMAKGGKVRGCGLATKGHGRGRMV